MRITFDQCEMHKTNIFKVLFANMQINIESAFVFVFVLRQARCGAGGDACSWCWLGTRACWRCPVENWHGNSAQLSSARHARLAIRNSVKFCPRRPQIDSSAVAAHTHIRVHTCEWATHEKKEKT